MPDPDTFLAAASGAVLVTVKAAKGSTPRDTDAWMLVSANSQFGTIGGGQLEFLAIDRSRAILAGTEPEGNWAQPLGPEIGQCCGGHVTLAFSVLDEAGRASLRARWQDAQAALPQVFLFGAGHVGTALAQALALLPFRVAVVETRATALEALRPELAADGPALVLTAMPDETVRSAPPGSAFIVLTHDHSLDFLIVAEALDRGDAAYVGMIGSATKRAVFRRWYLENDGSEERLSRLVCPIGGADVKDKRPAVIAALTAAELLRRLLSPAPDPG